MAKSESNDKVRLNKYLATSGVASRRAVDRMIEEGQITVNGKKVYELGVKVDPDNDQISINGKLLKKSTPMKLYILFNKPRGVLTTMEDPLERPTVADYLIKVPGRVFPVGRLDWDSEGLLILTNDGDFANEVMHPSKEVTKTYLVKINKQPADHLIEKLRRGVSIVGGRVAAKHIEKITKTGENKSEKYSWYKIVITEGKNRQIRQMFEKIGCDVLRLQRVAIGRLRLASLKAGEFVYINDAARERIFLADNPNEVKQMKKIQGNNNLRSLKRLDSENKAGNSRKMLQYKKSASSKKSKT